MPLTFGGKRKPGGTGPRMPLDPLEQRVTDRVAQVLRLLGASIDVDAYEQAIRALDPDLLERLLREVNIGEIGRLIDDTLRGVVISGASAEARQILANNPRINPVPGDALQYGGRVLPSGVILPTAQIPAPPDVEFAIEQPVDRMFRHIDVRATDYARTRSAQLVTDIDESNRLAIRRLITKSFTGPNPATVDQTARDLRKIVGLHTRWADAVIKFDDTNYRALLKQGLGEAEARAKADVLTKRYKDKLIRRRAEMIARTEIQQAGNYARQASWEASDRAGLIDPRAEKEWRTAPLGSSYGPPCDECREMRGKRVPWNGTFPNGRVFPPAHPHCRCTVVMVPPTRGLTGLPSQNMDDWIARLDALEAEDAVVKHLQGQHDQSSHGRKGGRSSSPAERATAAQKTGGPTGLTKDDLIDVYRNPEMYGFHATALDRGIAMGRGVRPDDAFLINAQVKTVEGGLHRREVRARKAKGVDDEWTDTEAQNAINLYETASQGSVVIAMDPNPALNFVQNGQYRTLFDTGTSNGAIAYEARREEEFASHDLHPNVDSSKRTVYGFVSMDTPYSDAVNGYGIVRMELKPEVKERATMTDGDSLGSGATPIPMTGGPISRRQAAGASLGWNSMHSRMSRTELEDPRDVFARENQRRYIEAQVRGGVQISDVARIYIRGPRPAATSPDVESTSTLYRLEYEAGQRGIPVVYEYG